ncbi:MAG TPA: hypothetical protein VHB97_19735, partial [Polyangia bacterium]|nr:hypothetical protein [Polyangia bacterium]
VCDGARASSVRASRRREVGVESPAFVIRNGHFKCESNSRLSHIVPREMGLYGCMQTLVSAR